MIKYRFNIALRAFIACLPLNLMKLYGNYIINKKGLVLEFWDGLLYNTFCCRAIAKR